MRLRTALKIMKAINTPDQDRYREGQLGAAVRRYEKTRSAKEANAFWFYLVKLYRKHNCTLVRDGGAI